MMMGSTSATADLRNRAAPARAVVTAAKLLMAMVMTMGQRMVVKNKYVVI